jgi:hypothetical protein
MGNGKGKREIKYLKHKCWSEAFDVVIMNSLGVIKANIYY